MHDVEPDADASCYVDISMMGGYIYWQMWMVSVS